MILAPHGTHRRMTLHLLHGMDLRETIRLPLGIIRQDMTDQVDFLNMTEITGKVMDKQIQDLAWACLPKDARKEVRMLWELDTLPVHPDYDPDSVAEGAAYILTELFGRHNLISNTEPEEMLMVEREFIIDLYEDTKKARWRYEDARLIRPMERREGMLLAMKNIFGDKCQPDTPNTPNSGELKSQKSEIQPKLNKGDKVKIINVANPMMRDEIGMIEELPTKDESRYKVRFEEDHWTLLEAENLEPYTEPEHPNMVKSPQLNKDTMEEKELNLGEFIKNCEGETFFHPRYGEVVINDINDEMIEIGIDGHGLISIPTKNNIFQSGLAQLYPNDDYFKKYTFDGHTAWMEWKSQRESEIRKPECTITDVNKWWELKVIAKFHSAKEAERGAEAVRECLENFHKDHPRP